MWTQQKVYIHSPRKSLEAQVAKNPLSFHILQEVCNNLWKNCAYCKESVKRASICVFNFPLSISIICISFCHLTAKSPVMDYICCSTFHAVLLLLLPLPPCLLNDHKPIFPILSPAFCLPDSSEQKWSPWKPDKGITLAHRYTKQ